eukprot:TRINITY_DN8006_c0_g1_i1.p1 TRINITY_DN8006_c0_g1~~TRINITY_DN8006_c0_g1_i1.p1  ORF type:complete len:181 (+),score=42.89 TRINITY_DN8006_c0_g1_i1:353-895(+)
MTIEAEPIRFARRMQLPLREYTPRVGRGKRHFDCSREASPIFGKGEAENVPKTTRPRNWQPSESLVHFNKKQLLCYIDSNKAKRAMPGKTINQCSIFNMTGIDTEVRRQKKCRLDDSKIQSIITYKDGPLFRATRIAEDVCRLNIAARTRTPEAIRTRHLQFAEYFNNKANGHKSHIPFS